MDPVTYVMKNKWTFILDSILRLFLLAIFLITEISPPFNRIIYKEEAWLYSNPSTASYFPTSVLWVAVVFFPLGTVALVYLGGGFKSSSSGRIVDAAVAVWCITLLLPLNGAVTNFIKVQPTTFA